MSGQIENGLSSHAKTPVALSQVCDLLLAPSSQCTCQNGFSLKDCRTVACYWHPQVSGVVKMGT